MSTETPIQDGIERAAASVGAAWPLHSFVTANPLAGFEDRPFSVAVRDGTALFGARGYPSADVFRRAWAAGQIDPDILSTMLAENGYDEDPETSLDRMAAEETETTTRASGTAEDRVEAVLTKWLEAFFDRGQADWALPNREQGFYGAVRTVARHDRQLPDRSLVDELPEDPDGAIAQLLADYPADQWEAIFEYHLTALPGWTGFIKHRVAAGDDWQSTYPVTLTGYLAIRLALTSLFDAPLLPPDGPHRSDATEAVTERAEALPLPAVWLAAWEASYRDELVDAVADAGRSLPDDSAEDDLRPAAQLVFCIDTRSEVIRRHIERTGPYETHGYAGFFGIPMRYEGYDASVSVDACPPIVDAQHRIAERPTDGDEQRQSTYDLWSRLRRAGSEVLHSLQRNPGTAFGFVESAGSGYGLALAARTLLPARVGDALSAVDDRLPAVHEFCTPTVDRDQRAGGERPLGLTLAEKVEYAASAFELMGWEDFARVVVFVGHAAQTANNPFDSSLDCGACAGNPGGPNARLLAAICNDETVRDALRPRDRCAVGHGLPRCRAQHHDRRGDALRQ